MESPTQTIKIEQSQSDRSKIPYHPVRYSLLMFIDVIVFFALGGINPEG